LQLQAALEGAGPFDPTTARRRFVLASADYTELLLLPPLVARVQAAAPHVDIAFRDADRLNARAVLEAGEADLVLVPFTEGLTELRSAVVLRDGFATIARRGHPMIGARLTLKRFLDLPHVLVSVEGEGTSLLDNALAARGLKRRIAVTVPHFTAAPFVVAASDAIATVPTRIARRLARPAGLAIHDPPLKIEGVTLHAIWHRRHDAQPAHRWLREEIAATAREI
jgi:DNA-binding transcriptional LysR family regulator